MLGGAVGSTEVISTVHSQGEVGGRSESMMNVEDVVRLSHKMAKKMIGDLWLAEDIAQNTIIALLGHDVPNGGYVIRSVKNKLIDHLRTRMIEETEFIDDIPSCENIEEIIMRREEILKVRQIVALLPRAYREILEDLLSGLSYRAIAKKYNVPIGTVRSRLNFAKQKFRKLWEEQYGKEAQDPCVCPIRGRCQRSDEGTRRH